MPTILPARHPGKPEPACNSLLEAALGYAARGWHVFPLHTPTARGCSCEKPNCKKIGKHPRTQHGLKDASTDSAIINGWWKRWPDANIGVATGPGSGIFVVDVDGEEGHALLKTLGQLPDTLRVHTGRTGPSGERTGFHLYFTCPAGMPPGTRAALMGKGLDVRAAGGYVVAPPSLHVSGLRYEWANARSIADAPASLIESASKAVGGPNPTPEGGFIYEGERDDRLFRLAAKWRREGATEDDLIMRLRGQNLRKCKPPLEDSQVIKIAHSAANCICVGSLDPLGAAWEKANAENHYYAYEKMVALIHHLASGPGCTILLPVERIGTLMGCDRTLIGRHRKRAIADGYIQEIEKYIPHQRATRFKVLRLPVLHCPTKE